MQIPLLDWVKAELFEMDRLISRCSESVEFPGVRQLYKALYEQL